MATMVSDGGNIVSVDRFYAAMYWGKYNIDRWPFRQVYHVPLFV